MWKLYNWFILYPEHNICPSNDCDKRTLLIYCFNKSLLALFLRSELQQSWLVRDGGMTLNTFYDIACTKIFFNLTYLLIGISPKNDHTMS